MCAPAAASPPIRWSTGALHTDLNSAGGLRAARFARFGLGGRDRQIGKTAKGVQNGLRLLTAFLESSDKLFPSLMNPR